MTILSELYEMLDDRFDIQLAIRKIESGLAISVLPKARSAENLKSYQASKAIIKPFIVSGPVEEVATGLIEGLRATEEATKAYVSNIDDYSKSLKKSTKTVTSSSSSASCSAPAPKDPKQERMEGSLVKAQVTRLCKNDEDTEQFKTTLAKATLATMKDAYQKVTGSAKRKQVETELKKLTGQTVEELGLSDQKSLFDILDIKKKDPGSTDTKSGQKATNADSKGNTESPDVKPEQNDHGADTPESTPSKAENGADNQKPEPKSKKAEDAIGVAERKNQPWQMGWKEWNQGEWRSLTESEVAQLGTVLTNSQRTYHYANFGEQTVYQRINQDGNPIGSWVLQTESRKPMTAGEHKEAVRNAILKGQAVYEGAFADYPDLRGIQSKPQNLRMFPISHDANDLHSIVPPEPNPDDIVYDDNVAVG